MSFDSKNLVLFCGGCTLLKGVDLPKPLHNVNGNNTIIHDFLDAIPQNFFNHVYLLVEKKWVTHFDKILNIENLNYKIVEVDDNSSTLDKLYSFVKAFVNQEGNYMFSYPDIFAKDAFWQFPQFPSDKVLITKRPLSSRFPRVFLEPFNIMSRESRTISQKFLPILITFFVENFFPTFPF